MLKKLVMLPIVFMTPLLLSGCFEKSQEEQCPCSEFWSNALQENGITHAKAPMSKILVDQYAQSETISSVIFPEDDANVEFRIWFGNDEAKKRMCDIEIFNQAGTRRILADTVTLEKDANMKPYESGGCPKWIDSLEQVKAQQEVAPEETPAQENSTDQEAQPEIPTEDAVVQDGQDAPKEE